MVHFFPSSSGCLRVIFKTWWDVRRALFLSRGGSLLINSRLEASQFLAYKGRTTDCGHRVTVSSVRMIFLTVNWRCFWHWLGFNALVSWRDREILRCFCGSARHQVVVCWPTTLVCWFSTMTKCGAPVRQKELLYTSFLTQDWVKPALIYLRNEI